MMRGLAYGRHNDRQYKHHLGEARNAPVFVGSSMTYLLLHDEYLQHLQAIKILETPSVKSRKRFTKYLENRQSESKRRRGTQVPLSPRPPCTLGHDICQQISRYVSMSGSPVKLRLYP